jgi:hypothetical protein
VTFASPGSFNVLVEKIKDSNEMVQSGLTVAPEVLLGIASVVITLAVAPITIAAKMLSFVPSNEQDVLDTSSHLFYVR